MVVLKGSLASVMAVVVGFDNQPLASPKEVDEKRANPNVDLGRWQSMTATQAQKVSLQVTARAIATLVADRQADHAGLADRIP